MCETDKNRYFWGKNHEITKINVFFFLFTLCRVLLRCHLFFIKIFIIMELIVGIVEQYELKERTYQDKQTMQQKTFASRGFILSHGADRFYCEMVEEDARQYVKLVPNIDFPSGARVTRQFVATINSRVRKWNDQNGEERFENRLILSKLLPI